MNVECDLDIGAVRIQFRRTGSDMAERALCRFGRYISASYGLIGGIDYRRESRQGNYTPARRAENKRSEQAKKRPLQVRLLPAARHEFETGGVQNKSVSSGGVFECSTYYLFIRNRDAVVQPKTGSETAIASKGCRNPMHGFTLTVYRTKADSLPVQYWWNTSMSKMPPGQVILYRRSIRQIMLK